MTRPSSLPLLALALFALAPALVASPSATRIEETAEALVREGRALLEAGHVHQAQAVFERAVVLDGSPDVRFWLVRGWVAQERFDDALMGADELRTAGASGTDCDYLLGLAFLGAAKQAISQSGGGTYTQDQLGDAYRLLSAVVETDPARFEDIWMPLAESGWYAQQLEGARAAVEQAVERRPDEAEVHALRGRIAFSQYSAARAAGDSEAQADSWEVALVSFQRAIELYGEPTDAAGRTALAQAHRESGNLFAWKQDLAAAAPEYAQAMGWDPTSVDFAQMRSSLGPAFGDCIADGARRFRERFGADQPAFATLSWWDGYARFERGDWAASEQAFRTAVRLWPDYTNSWYYLFRLTYSQGEYAEAVEALHSYAQVDREGLVAMLSSSAADQVRVIDYLVGWCANPDEHGGRALNEEAAMLSDLLTRVQPDVSRHWSNLGLFVRDRGDQLRWSRGRAEGEGVDPDELQRLWLRAFDAYGRALELQPDNPNYVNDYAVMLHYYLLRDFDEAQQMYVRSQALAEAALARDDLPAAEREVVAIALRDSKDNQRRLAQYLERVAAGEDIDPNRVR